VPAPANDNFASRIALAAEGGTVGPIDAHSATTEGSEPNATFTKQTIWYSWTAPFDGRITFNFTGTTFSGGESLQLGLYTGSVLGSLTEILDWTGFWPGEPALQFQADSGVTYQIQVGSTNAATATFTVQFSYWFGGFTPLGVSVAFANRALDPTPGYVRLDA
jgi:hypothetical protein